MDKKFQKTLNRISKETIPVKDTPAPLYNCPVCQDTGLRKLQIGEVYQSTGITINGKREQVLQTIVAAPDGSPYPDVSVACEACLPRRMDQQRTRYQELSRFTPEEKKYSLKSIALSPTRPGTTEMVKAGSELLGDDCSMLTIWGRNGNAKTLMLMALVNTFLDMGKPALYITAFDMLQFIQDAYDKDGQQRSGSGSALDRIEMLKGVQFLAIDEFQAIKETQWATAVLDNLIDRRYRDAVSGETKTILAMNEAPELVSARNYSRLKDGRLRKSGSPIIRNDDPDLRSKMERR